MDEHAYQQELEQRLYEEWEAFKIHEQHIEESGFEETNG